MVFRTFLDKCNTIVKGSNDNFGLNPILMLHYGGLVSRILIHFDIEELKNRIGENVDNFSVTANIDKQIYYCDWKSNGKDALKIRNDKVINDADAIIVFEDGTRDTNFFIEMSKNSNKPLRIVKL